MSGFDEWWNFLLPTGSDNLKLVCRNCWDAAVKQERERVAKADADLELVPGFGDWRG